MSFLFTQIIYFQFLPQKLGLNFFQVQFYLFFSIFFHIQIFFFGFRTFFIFT